MAEPRGCRGSFEEGFNPPHSTEVRMSASSLSPLLLCTLSVVGATGWGLLQAHKI